MEWYERGFREGILSGPIGMSVLGWAAEEDCGFHNGNEVGSGQWPGCFFNRLCGHTDGSAPLMRELLAGRLISSEGLTADELGKRDGRGRTFLLKAVGSGLPIARTVDSLLRQGADPKATDLQGNTALICASRWNRPEILRRLIEAGASVTATNRFGNTALHRAAGSAGVEVVRLLIESGADVNARDRSGTTPLMWAVNYRQVESTAVLVARGADVNAIDGRGERVIEYGVSNQSDRPNPAIRLLIEHRADLTFIEALPAWRQKRLREGIEAVRNP